MSMIDQRTLDQWTSDHACVLADIHQWSADIMGADPLTAAASGRLNKLNAACAELATLTHKCEGVIRTRYDEAREAGDSSPEDARVAVAHLRDLRGLTQSIARQCKAQCRHWAAGTWAASARVAAITERKGKP